MRKKILNFTAIVTMLFFVACSNEELVPEVKTETARTLSLSATMPGNNNPNTRVALEQEGKDIVLTWELGDIIYLAFVQNNESALESSAVTSISEDGKRASFNIPIPEGISSEESFEIYGVYGLEGTLIFEEQPYVLLSNSSGNAGTLAQVQDRKDVMLFFETTVEATDTDISVSFNHLGSLFSITINNINESVGTYLLENGINEFRLAGVDPLNQNWAYFSRGNDIVTAYNFITKSFYEPQNARNYIYFNPTGETIDGVITLWAWYPILPGQVWPDLQLQMGTAGDTFGDNFISSTNNKTSRTVAPEPGKSYSLYATFNADNSISFTDKDFNIIP